MVGWQINGKKYPFREIKLRLFGFCQYLIGKWHPDVELKILNRLGSPNNDLEKRKKRKIYYNK